MCEMAYVNRFPHCRQVETGGDSLTCMAICSSGEALALGGSGGYIHLWTDQPEVPTVNRFPEELEVRPHIARMDGGRGLSAPP